MDPGCLSRSARRNRSVVVADGEKALWTIRSSFRENTEMRTVSSFSMWWSPKTFTVYVAAVFPAPTVSFGCGAL